MLTTKIITKLINKSNNESFSFNPKKINIFVGPNNSGKSYFLKNLFESLGTYNFNEHNLISEISYLSYPVFEEFETKFKLLNKNKIFVNNNGEEVIFDNEDTFMTKEGFLKQIEELAYLDFHQHLDESYPGWRDLPILDLIPLVKGNDLTLESFSYTNNDKTYYVDYFSPTNLNDRIHSEFSIVQASEEATIMSSKDAMKLLLDGKNRLDFFNMPEPIRLNKNVSFEAQSNYLDDVFHSEELYDNFQRITKEAFNKYFCVDHISSSGYGSIKLSDTKLSDTQRHSLEDSTYYHLQEATPITHFSDGVISYVSTLMNVLTKEHSIFLIDEPEAFLHPSLANTLGKELANFSKDNNKQLFISTHSSDFIMGCALTGIDMNIIRLDYDYSHGFATCLDNDAIKYMMKNPLLRSENTLKSLFFKSAIIVEADSDRTIYQELNFRLNKINSPIGINDVIFLNAKNLQTIPQFIEHMNKIFIPSVSIVDLDILVDKNFGKFLDSAGISTIDKSAINSRKNGLITKLREKLDIPLSSEKDNSTIRKLLKEQGFLLFKNYPELCTPFESLISDLNKFGIFPVSVGELENWFPDAQMSHGDSGIPKLLKYLGDDELSPNYYIPTDSDPFFIFYKSISDYLK